MKLLVPKIIIKVCIQKKQEPKPTQQLCQIAYFEKEIR